MDKVKLKARPTLFVLLVGVIGLLIAYQGWNSRIVNYDLIPYIEDAHEFIAHKRIPQKGTLTSFASYTPPGITWLMIPGAYLLSEPRLFESIGCALLYIGTLVGIFLLARDYIGITCAYLAVALWGVSELGLFFAQSSWARGHPFFYVWMVYWAGKWVERGSANYLAVALIIWAVGMYVFLEIAPALFIIPVLWLLYRPSLQLWPLLLAGVLIAIIWYPYLQFEAGRGFTDLKSQVLRQRIRPSNFKDFWCNPALAPDTWQADFTTPNTGSDRIVGSSHSGSRGSIGYIHLFGERLYLIFSLLLISNFNHIAGISGTNIFLLIVTLAGLLLLSAQGLDHGRRLALGWQIDSPTALKWLGIAMMLVAIFINELLMARYTSLDGTLEPATILTIRWLQALLIVGGLVLVMLRQAISTGLHWLITLEPFDTKNAYRLRNSRMLAVSLIIPWLLLLLMTEADRLERFWWLWPLQIVVLSSVVTYWPLQLRLSHAVVWFGSLILLLMITGNHLVLSRLAAWAREGWSGRNAEEINVVDYIAHVASNKQRAAIGYDLDIYRFMPIFNAVDPRYKVGAGFDLLFKYRHGIINVNRCAEGVSSEDQYRIVQTGSGEGKDAARQRLSLPVDNRFYISQQFGSYQVFQSR